MTQLSPEAQAILNAGRDALSPSDLAKEQVFQSLQASLSSPAALPSTGFLGTTVKLVSILALIAGIGGGWWLYSSGNDGNTAEVVAHEIVAHAELSSLTPAQVTPQNSPTTTSRQEPEQTHKALPAEVETKSSSEPAPKKQRPRSRSKQKRVRPATQNNLLAEQKLIASAQRAIADGNYKRATALLAKHKAQFPKGILSPEREGARAIALCKGADQSAGTLVARTFLRNNSSSPLAQRVKRSCGLP